MKKKRNEIEDIVRKVPYPDQISILSMSNDVNPTLRSHQDYQTSSYSRKDKKPQLHDFTIQTELNIDPNLTTLFSKIQVLNLQNQRLLKRINFLQDNSKKNKKQKELQNKESTKNLWKELRAKEEELKSLQQQNKEYYYMIKTLKSENSSLGKQLHGKVAELKSLTKIYNDLKSNKNQNLHYNLLLEHAKKNYSISLITQGKIIQLQNILQTQFHPKPKQQQNSQIVQLCQKFIKNNQMIVKLHKNIKKKLQQKKTEINFQYLSPDQTIYLFNKLAKKVMQSKQLRKRMNTELLKSVDSTIGQFESQKRSLMRKIF